MEKTGLNALLSENSKARNYFGSLPDYIQGGVMLHSSEINSEDELHSCADMIKSEFAD